MSPNKHKIAKIDQKLKEAQEVDVYIQAKATKTIAME